MIKNVVVVLSVLSSVAAFANSGNTTTVDGPATENSRVLNWESFKQACKSPSDFNSQVAQSQIEITCEESRTRWVQEQATLPLQESRRITYSISSNKYNVDPVTDELTVAPSTGSCPRFREIQETFSTARSVSCQDVVNYNGALRDFCANAVDQSKKHNVRSVVRAYTSRKPIDGCPAGATMSSSSPTVVGE